MGLERERKVIKLEDDLGKKAISLIDKVMG